MSAPKGEFRAEGFEVDSVPPRDDSDRIVTQRISAIFNRLDKGTAEDRRDAAFLSQLCLSLQDAPWLTGTLFRVYERKGFRSKLTVRRRKKIQASNGDCCRCGRCWVVLPDRTYWVDMGDKDCPEVTRCPECGEDLRAKADADASAERELRRGSDGAPPDPTTPTAIHENSANAELVETMERNVERSCGHDG